MPRPAPRRQEAKASTIKRLVPVRGAHELRVKESDRLAAMAQGLGRLGVEHELLADGVWIRGGAGFSAGSSARA